MAAAIADLQFRDVQHLEKTVITDTVCDSRRKIPVNPAHLQNPLPSLHLLECTRHQKIRISPEDSVDDPLVVQVADVTGMQVSPVVIVAEIARKRDGTTSVVR